MVTIKELHEICRDTKEGIEDEYRATEEDTEPSTMLTVGVDENGDIGGAQTGDNSFTGGAYGSPIWAVTYVYRDSNCDELARDLQKQILDRLGQLREAV